MLNTRGNILYRLHFINYHKIDNKINHYGLIDWPFKPFKLPTNMPANDAFKVLSYLSNYIEKNLDLKLGTYQNVEVLDRILNIKRLGFKKLNVDVSAMDVIDLFIVSGQIELFKYNSNYDKYFNWYSQNISLNEIKRIYQKINMDFYPLDQIEDTKKLIKKLP